MYKVLIVDDEEDICRGLKILIDWEIHGFHAKDHSTDGRQAFDMISSGDYDLIITDLKMPEMDGLALIRKLRETGYTQKVIILSAYKDFDYARQAMNYGVEDYLLKPVNEEGLEKVIIKIRRELDRDTSRSIMLQESRAVLQEKALNKILKTDDIDDTDIDDEKLKKLFPKVARYLVAAAEIHETVEVIEEDILLKEKKAVMNIIRNSVEGRGIGYVLKEDSNRVSMILILGEQIGESPTDIIDQLYNSFKDLENIKVTLASGNIVDDIVSIAASYKNCLDALSRKKFIESGGMISYRDICSGEQKSEDIPDEYCLIETIKEKGEQDIIDAVEEYFQAFKNKLWPVRDVCGRIVNFFIETAMLCSDMGFELKGILGVRDFYEKIYEHNDLEELRKLVLDTSIKVSECIKERKYVNSDNETVKKIIDEITDNYGESGLSLKELAQGFYMNPTYLGRIFKSETGMYFKDFLNKVRIDAAKRLLGRTNTKVYEVCGKVGYKDINYFYRIFKSMTGTTPSEYRSNIEDS